MGVTLLCVVNSFYVPDSPLHNAKQAARNIQFNIVFYIEREHLFTKSDVLNASLNEFLSISKLSSSLKANYCSLVRQTNVEYGEKNPIGTHIPTAYDSSDTAQLESVQRKFLSFVVLVLEIEHQPHTITTPLSENT